MPRSPNRALAEQSRALENAGRHSEAHTRWAMRVLSVLEEVFGRKSRYYLSFAALDWAETGSFLIGGPGDPEASWNPSKAVERRHQAAYVRDLGTARGFLLAAADKLERSEVGAVYEGKDTAPESSLIVKVINLAGPPLRTVIRATPASEKDVQDAKYGNILFIVYDVGQIRDVERVTASRRAR